MHMQGRPESMQNIPISENELDNVRSFLMSQAQKLEERGVFDIILDPGFGLFGKTLDANYCMLRELSSFKYKNYGLLAGISRKSMIGNVVQSLPEERMSGSIALHTIAILNGATIIRVHDVKEAYQAVKVTEKYMSKLPG